MGRRQNSKRFHNSMCTAYNQESRPGQGSLMLLVCIKSLYLILVMFFIFLRHVSFPFDNQGFMCEFKVIALQYFTCGFSFTCFIHVLLTQLLSIHWSLWASVYTNKIQVTSGMFHGISRESVGYLFYTTPWKIQWPDTINTTYAQHTTGIINNYSPKWR